MIQAVHHLLIYRYFVDQSQNITYPYSKKKKWNKNKIRSLCTLKKKSGEGVDF